MVTNGCTTSLLKYIYQFFLIYLFIYLFQMTFDDNQFSVVLDKGTFDALMSNKSQQV
jgi:hypothetical protein